MPIPLAVGLGVASIGTSLASGFFGRKAAKKSGKYASRALTHQAYIQGIQGKMTERQLVDNYELFRGTMAVRRAKSGVTWEGSPTLMAKASAELAAIDAYVARWSTQESQNQLYKQARAARKGASMSGTASVISGFASALGTAYQMAPST